MGREHHTTLKEILNEALRAGFQVISAKTKRRPAIDMPLHRHNGPKPGVDIADRSALYDAINPPLSIRNLLAR